MQSRDPIEHPANANSGSLPDEASRLEIAIEGIEFIERKQQVEREAQEESEAAQRRLLPERQRDRIRRLFEAGKRHRTSQLLFQIWRSDYSILAFIITMVSFYAMRVGSSPTIGVLFFLFAMAEIDAMLSTFVVRLSSHQDKLLYYAMDDFERDFLRYRMLLFMSKAALLFVVTMSCGTTALIACYVMWFFTTTQRLRYIILRSSIRGEYPELQRWSIFALLREAGIEPGRRNFDLLALIGLVLGFGIVLLF